MLQALNQWWVAALALAGFIWLSYASHPYENRGVGYSQSEFSVLDKQRLPNKAAEIMNLWHITPQEVNEPIRIFGN